MRWVRILGLGYGFGSGLRVWVRILGLGYGSGLEELGSSSLRIPYWQIIAGITLS